MQTLLNSSLALRIGAICVLGAALAGCETRPAVPAGAEPDVTPRSYMRLYQQDTATQDRGITLVAQQEVLQRAIRHAFPDKAIRLDSGIDLTQRINVWSENLTPAAYLDHLSSQANVSISLTGQNSIQVKATDEKAFRLPADVAEELMPQAELLARSHGAQVLKLNDANVLLVSGPPNALRKTERALRQLNSRVTLEDVLRGTSGTHKSE